MSQLQLQGPTTTCRDEHGITAGVPAEVQQTLELAASIVGATVNQFVVQSALRKANRIIEQDRVIAYAVR